jgi:hypothetical protein
MKKNRILGVAMIPNMEIYRNPNEVVNEEHKVYFTADTIATLRQNFHLKEGSDSFSINHGDLLVKNVKLIKSFLINTENRNSIPLSFRHLPDGTWMIEYEINNEEILLKIKNGELTGFSVEGKFTLTDDNGVNHTVIERFRIMNKLSELLSFNIYVQGGSTGGAGRNEHGEAHFELKEKNSGKKIGKIFMPSLDIWIQSNRKERITFLTVDNGIDITKREKKIFIDWLEQNNNENLLRCHKEWNETNEFNNRVQFI